MNERINVAELIKKYANEGDKFYSVISGLYHRICFPLAGGLAIDGAHPILNNYGQVLGENNGECLLFPSKDQRDWGKWEEEKWEECQKFSVFQRVLVRNGTQTTWKLGEFAFTDSSSPGLKFYVLGGNRFQFCIPYEGNEHLLGTTNRPEKGGEE